jgi:long-chain acyl-CoA synthetase
MTEHRLSRRIAHVLGLQPDAKAIEYEGQWNSWGSISGTAHRVGALTRGGMQVGILLRNQPVHVAALLGALQSGACVVVINPGRGDDRTRADIDALGLPLIVGAPNDVATLVTPSAQTSVATITGLDDEPVVAGSGAADGGRPGVAVRMLTSGTTGPPKRIDLTYDMLARSVMGADDAPAPLQLRRGVAIVNAPLVHIGGVFRVLQCVCEARSFALLEKFDLDLWTDAVCRHRPRAVSLVPAALRMVLHSDLTRDDLASIRAVTSGTAPLSADDVDAFTAKFGIPVLTSYAATEFGGGVAGWTLADYQTFWQEKRGSLVCWRSSPASWGRRASGSGLLTWLASTPMASCGSSGARTRRSSAAGSRSCPRTSAVRLRATLRYEARPWSAGLTGVSVKYRLRWSNCGKERPWMLQRSPSSSAPGWRATRFPSKSRSSTRSRELLPARLI